MAEKGINIEVSGVDLGTDAIEQIYADMNAENRSFGIVVARFNIELTSALLTSCIGALKQHGAKDESITVTWVPGSYEIPVILKQLAEQKSPDVLIALGCVIQGETPHAELINHSLARAITALSLEYKTPIINEVVGAYTLEQAEARCLSGETSRGWYAGCAAIEMSSVNEKVASL